MLDSCNCRTNDPSSGLLLCVYFTELIQYTFGCRVLMWIHCAVLSVSNNTKLSKYNPLKWISCYHWCYVQTPKLFDNKVIDEGLRSSKNKRMKKDIQTY